MSAPHALRRWRSTHWDRHTAWYLAYRLAAYVVMNLGEDASIVALMFC